MRRFEKARRIVTAFVVAVLVAALSYSISSVVVSSHVAPKFSLTAMTGFSITGKIYATTCVSTPDARLFPGTPRCLVVTVTNPYGASLSGTVTMTVTSFTKSPTATGPKPCTVTTVAPTSFTASFSAPAHTTAQIDMPFALKTTGNQDACESGTFHFRFTGTATVTYAASCETVSITPDLVTTKTGTLGHLDVSGGTVFLAPTAVVKGNVTVASTGVLVSTGATITGNVTSSGGQVALEAATSVEKNVTANGGKLAIGTTTTVSGTVTATGTKALCIDGASSSTMVAIGGSVTVKHMPNSSLASICASDLGANLTYRTNGATATIGHKTSLTLPTGSLCATGSFMTGTLVVTTNTGKVTVSYNTTAGNLPAKDNTAALVITTNDIVGNHKPNSGNLTVISNTGGITVTNNTVFRNVTVSLNAGGTLVSNTVTQNCNLKNDTPPVHGATNTVSGTVDTCNGTH